MYKLDKYKYLSQTTVSWLCSGIKFLGSRDPRTNTANLYYLKGVDGARQTIIVSWSIGNVLYVMVTN
jgi:hypothetical protein